jgi:hypothetical protein
MRWAKSRELRILDFDIECRPLSWYGGEWVTKEVTAIGCRFLDRKQGRVWLLGRDEPREMLEEFVRGFYDVADVVTGHYIRGFDLPSLNGALIDNGLPVLGDKLAQDTKTDLVKFDGLSKSQENLGALLGLKHPKVGMNQQTWREANRLTPGGIMEARKRVLGDVEQHIEFRQKLLDMGLLGPPKLWTSGPGRRAAAYAA